MWLQFGLCVFTAFVACALHQWRYLCTFEFIVFCIVASNRFNGDLVLYTEANLQLKWPEYLLLVGCFATYLENTFVRTYVVAILDTFLTPFINKTQQYSKDTLLHIHPTAWIFISICFIQGLFKFLRILHQVREIDKNKVKQKCWKGSIISKLLFDLLF
ncbi:hypothetical protein RFI_11169 [Reticulomyxa filosa]|uniref:Uncharacterized protein n=1 Tax=Reticulomyxa filosa TaxID=46433 RepID=X6NJS4_RETFI|nr:hypothetical protein RFI_11169 [Reticulomyxa filosa]|eukprot:ETO25969.1 hypothetical protein RFI_11169 [Reticulomyxa filosa]